MSNKVTKIKFIRPYAPKIWGSNAFNKKMDTTDQRSPINEPEDLFNQFMIDEEIQDELDNEQLDDFDNDVYDYDDRSEFGEDVLAAQQPNIAAAAKRLKINKKKK